MSVSVRKDKPEKLDEATELALDWAIATLRIDITPDDASYLKVQQLKAQAANLAAALKARTDPAAMRGKKSDRVGEVLAARLAAAGAARDGSR